MKHKTSTPAQSMSSQHAEQNPLQQMVDLQSVPSEQGLRGKSVPPKTKDNKILKGDALFCFPESKQIFC